MLVMIVIILGLVSLVKLPVELYPNTSFGEISIIIYVRGQIPPSEVESQVTKHVEDAVSTVSNLRQVISISKEGESTVVLSFDPGTDMDFAALEVREKFSRVSHKLPKEIEKPIIAQFKQHDVPILIFAVTSPVRPPEIIRRLVDESLKENLKRVNGVANVEVAGGRERKILVEIDQQKMVAYGVAMDEITGTLSANNLNLLSGEVERTEDKLLIRMIGEFDSMAQIRNMGIKLTEYGSILRVGDVATVKDDYLEPGGYARYNRDDIVSIYIQKETTANTIKVVKGVLDEVERVKKKFPRDVQLVPTSNGATLIKNAIDSLDTSLLQGAVLVFLIFFLFLFRLSKFQLLFVCGCLVMALILKGIPLLILFLGLLTLLFIRPRWRSIIVINIPIPVSVIATFLFMRFSGLTLNVMTLFGLAISTGHLVDSSIVIFDNILKKREEGMPVREAAIEGSRELVLAICASTMASVIVFLPLIFMSKDIQLLYSSMAMTVIVSLLISLVCALTLVPLMCSIPFFAAHMIVRKKRPGEKEWLDHVYVHERNLMTKALRNAPKTIVIGLVVFAVSLLVVSRMPVEYMGSTEQNKFTIFIEMPTGTRLDITNDTVKRLEKVLKGYPEVKNTTSRVEPWSSKIYVELVPATMRKRSTSQVIETLRPQAARLKPAFIYFEEEEQVGTKEITLEVFGYDYAVLRQLAIGIANRLESISGLTDMKIRMREGRPEMGIIVDKSRAATLNVTTQAVADQVHASMRGLRATLFREEAREVETITRLQEKYRKTFRDLYKMIISDPYGNPVLLEQVANFKFDLGPSEIWRKNKDRMIQVSANLGKIPLSTAVAKVHEKLADLDFPEDYYYRVGGDYSNLIKMKNEMNLVISMVLILIYLVLASLFESFTEPLLIMTAIPLALAGAVVGLFLGPRTIGIGAMLGMMMLAGLSTNHSIVLIDRINFFMREKKMKPLKAVIRANKDRLRPILLTDLTTILGLVPMAIDHSPSANLWSPVAWTVIGGLVSSLILTLIGMPSFFFVFLWLREKAVLLPKIFNRKVPVNTTP